MEKAQSIKPAAIYKIKQLRLEQAYRFIQFYQAAMIQNPESGSSGNNIPTQTMYQYQRGTNINWNMDEYKTPREYLDPSLEVMKRTWATQKKGQPNRKYLTKRGFYMDYDLKIAKAIPSSVQHVDNKPWSMEHLKDRAKFNKIDKNLLKNTYLEQIQNEQKKRKVPGIATYSLQKSLKQKEKEIEQLKKVKKMQEKKRFFHEDNDFNMSKIPGAGQYNPHQTVEKLKMDKTDYKYWVAKHKKQHSLSQKREMAKPGSFTYKPMNMTIDTFDRTSLSPKSQHSKFGNSPRFSYQKQEKIKIKEIRPSPNSYKTTLQWKGKGESPKFKPWNTAIWKGKNHSTISVYGTH